MGNNVQQILKERLAAEVDTRFGVELQDIVAETPPQVELGDLAFTVAFDLARKARKAPRKIAEELAPVLRETEGVERVDIAGAGYLNVFLARGPYLEAFCSGTYGESPPPTSRSGKVIVEHTNINPNKAAHIGHLRNAALGDTFVRVLQFCRETVEVQNYIDDTGVQVADVVVGFLDLAKKGLKEIQALAEEEQFDYYCWNLYAKVTEYFAADPARVARREATLKAIEEGAQPRSSDWS